MRLTFTLQLPPVAFEPVQVSRALPLEDLRALLQFPRLLVTCRICLYRICCLRFDFNLVPLELIG